MWVEAFQAQLVLDALHWAQLGPSVDGETLPGRCFSYIAGSSSGRQCHLSPLPSRHFHGHSAGQRKSRGLSRSEGAGDTCSSLSTAVLGAGLGWVNERKWFSCAQPLPGSSTCQPQIGPCRGCLPPTSTRIKSGTTAAADLQPPVKGARGREQKWWKAVLCAPGKLAGQVFR